MKKNSDKTQGVVFVLPKSKEFFGRISEDFQKVGQKAQDQKIISQRTQRKFIQALPVASQTEANA